MSSNVFCWQNNILESNQAKEATEGHLYEPRTPLLAFGLLVISINKYEKPCKRMLCAWTRGVVPFRPRMMSLDKQIM